ncbi:MULTISPECIES: YciI family protein [Nocardioides]|uniref:YciI family protein n=1 Tax=Nocardioides vastitatis TaxID=2568655 RepID=A0ABW0ZMR0_9ACTN|nr:YciI family protein [Nocardioides sp.]
MTQYMLTVHDDTESVGKIPPEQMQQMFEDVEKFNTKLRETGAWVFAGGLMPAETATVVDGTGTAPVFSDGPYLETKEHIGGFWVVEAADLDAALELAAEGSKACQGKVEVRPFQAEPPADA